MTATQLARKTALTGTGLLAAFALAACGTADDDTATTPQETAMQNTTTQSPAPAANDDDQDDTGTASPTAAATSPTAAPGTGTASVQGGDPAYAAIDAIIAQHPNGIVVEMDLDDDDRTWEVDVVVGEEVKEYDVTTDGEITEGLRPQIEDDVRRAGEAEITAEQAITTALEGRDGQTVDEVDLDDEDGRLRWEVELDREDGEDGAELKIDAKTGEVISVEEG